MTGISFKEISCRHVELGQDRLALLLTLDELAEERDCPDLVRELRQRALVRAEAAHLLSDARDRAN